MDIPVIQRDPLKFLQKIESRDLSAYIFMPTLRGSVVS